MQNKPSLSQILNILLRAVLLGIGTAFVASLIVMFVFKVPWQEAADRVRMLPGSVTCAYSVLEFYRLRQQPPPSNPQG
jgi:hypothetical protein